MLRRNFTASLFGFIPFVGNKSKEAETFIQHGNVTFAVKNGKVVREIIPGTIIRWYRDGKLHREDGPAVECANGDKLWYRNGVWHREDGPALEYANSTKQWYRDGKRHREDGPALEDANGDKSWFRNGVLHREDGPAVERVSGFKAWFCNGKLQRAHLLKSIF